RDYRIRMCKGLVNGQRVHLFSHALASLQRRFQIMPGNLNGEGIRNRAPSSLLVFHPGRMRQSHPHGAAIDKEFDVDRVSMAGRNGDNQGLINTVHLLLGPAVGGVEVLVHRDTLNIAARQLPTREATSWKRRARTSSEIITEILLIC